MVVSGNNAKKTEYILKAVEAGINVLADKPMVITPDEFPKLEQAFKVAQEKGVLLYDIMTERFEITTMLQRELSKIQDSFWHIANRTRRRTCHYKGKCPSFFENRIGQSHSNVRHGFLIPNSRAKELWM